MGKMEDFFSGFQLEKLVHNDLIKGERKYWKKSKHRQGGLTGKSGDRNSGARETSGYMAGIPDFIRGLARKHLTEA